ncbi:MAG: zinc-ribbon domain-containing protein, partial [Deltaproteobacteria bacterium]|nr:zinc-ribbon domain-containing protein [Deltaproteobacteria bacterium]
MAFSCPKCGAEIAEGRTFCLACGAYLAPHAASGPASGPASVGPIPGSTPQVSAPTRAYGPGDSASLAPVGLDPAGPTPARTGPPPNVLSPTPARTGPPPNASVPSSAPVVGVSGGAAPSSSAAAHAGVANTMQAISGVAGPMASPPGWNAPPPARSPRA